MTQQRIPFQNAWAKPHIPSEDGKTNIIHVVVNIESWPFEKEMPREIMPAPHGRQPIPNIANFSWLEYGLRLGLPRLLNVFKARDLVPSAFINSAITDTYPEIAHAVKEQKWDVVGHGIVQHSLAYEENESKVIETSLNQLESFFGYRPRGWFSPGYGESLETPDILAASGIEYTFDWTVDEIPLWMNTSSHEMMAIPYAIDLNDVTVFMIERQSVNEYMDRFIETFRFYDSDPRTRITTIALHPHIAGVPHRINIVSRLLDFLLDRDDTVFLNASEIYNRFK